MGNMVKKVFQSIWIVLMIMILVVPAVSFGLTAQPAEAA